MGSGGVRNNERNTQSSSELHPFVTQPCVRSSVTHGVMGNSIEYMAYVCGSLNTAGGRSQESMSLHHHSTSA
jgi:hypothetical protein